MLPCITHTSYIGTHKTERLFIYESCVAQFTTKVVALSQVRLFSRRQNMIEKPVNVETGINIPRGATSST